MKQTTRTAGQQATAGYARVGVSTWRSRYAQQWSVACPATIVMTAKPGIGAFADHANLPSRRLKETSH